MRCAGVFILFVFLVRSVAIAGDAPCSPAPSASPGQSAPADVTEEDDPTTTLRTLSFQTTYTGATYGPGNNIVTQIIPRLATVYIGKSILRLSPPRLQTVNGIDSGYSDTQFFYLFKRRSRVHRAFVGVSGNIPTASSPLFGTGKWAIGPSAAYLFEFQPGRSIFGILIQSAFSFAGAANRPTQSIITVLPIATYQLGHGWYLKWPEGTWVFDLVRGASLIPVGLGIGRATSFEGMPLLLAISDETSFLRANVVNAPKNTIRFTLTFLLQQSTSGRRVR